MAVATDFRALFADYYNSVDESFVPILTPTAAQIQQLFLLGQLQFPFAVQLTAGSLSGGLFKVSTEVTTLNPNFIQPLLTTGTVEKFEVSYAADGQTFVRLFDVLPRLGSELSFTVGEYNGFVTTKGTIFAYFLNLLDTVDPAKAIQLDFPGGSAETAFDLGALGQTGLAALGQVFDLPGNEDKDFYSFSIDQGGVALSLASQQVGEAASDVTISLWKGEALLKAALLSGGQGQLQVSDLEAGDYLVSLDAVGAGDQAAAANLEYTLEINALPDLPPLPPLRLNADNVQLPYVCYYGRPADLPEDLSKAEGYNFWKPIFRDSGIDYSPRSGDVLTPDERVVYNRIVGDFGVGQEYQGLFAGKDLVQQVDAIYRYCFNRDSEIDPLLGVNYWVGELGKGNITLSQAALEVALGAQGADRDFLNNRLQSANVFFERLDTAAERRAYAGDVAGSLARSWLQGFGATVATADEADAVIAQIVAAAPPV